FSLESTTRCSIYAADSRTFTTSSKKDEEMSHEIESATHHESPRIPASLLDGVRPSCVGRFAALERTDAEHFRPADNHLLASLGLDGALLDSLRWPARPRISRRPVAARHAKTLGADASRRARGVPERLAEPLRRVRVQIHRARGEGVIPVFPSFRAG